jgi:serine/threonine protein phosphatase PrpC
MARKLVVDVSEHIGGRPYMEDRYVIEPNFYNDWSLFAVFDGHGGSYVSEWLKNNFTNILKECLTESPRDLQLAIHNAIKNVVTTISVTDSLFCGSTVCAVMIAKDKLMTINIGDSRSIIGYVPSRTLVQLTQDHKPSLPSEEKRIHDSGGAVVVDSMGTPRVNGNLALSRAVGDFAEFPHVLATPDITRVDLSAHDKLHVAIATDGIWDVLSNMDVMMMMNEGLHGRDIIDIASKRGSMDNMTIITIEITKI